MPTLRQAVMTKDRTRLSSFSGIILTIVLYHRYHRHVLASGDLGYNFWQHHYQIDKDIRFYSTELLEHLEPSRKPGDLLAICLYANLCAIQISLHEHAIRKVVEDGLPDMLRVEGENQCLRTAMKVAGHVGIVVQLGSFEVGGSPRR